MARAQFRVDVLERVAALHAGGVSKRKALAEVASGTHWSTFRNWEKRSAERTGAAWERQLDGRIPPPVVGTPDEVRHAAAVLRRASSTMDFETARRILVEQFGDDRGGISDSTLGRIWRSTGLVGSGADGGGVAQTETVESLSGGGGLALLGAAMAELGLASCLGTAAVDAAKQSAVSQAEVEPLPASLVEAESHRDASGRLTGAYNRAARGSGSSDPRFASDSTKRQQRKLSTLRLSTSSPRTAGGKLLVMGLTPLVTERRGFVGLSNPSGGWLAATGLPAYQGASLDKALAEMAQADCDDALWSAHGKLWAEVAGRWSTGEGVARWLRYVLYIDGTQDPYWTQRFAHSGKVSRVGRVMPCLARVAVTGGPGVPLLIETEVGTLPLANRIEPLLERVEEIVGDGELGRFTVIDAEAGTLPTMSMLAARPNRVFVTVIKGRTSQAVTRSGEGEFVPFRNKDRIRPVTIEFISTFKPDEETTPSKKNRLRGVEMIRDGSRNPTTTLFVTNATEEQLSLAEIPALYLSRWPHQEQRFRDGRNGLGLERSPGYGGDYVEHVALQTKLDKASQAVERSRAQLARAKETEADTTSAWQTAIRGMKDKARKVMNLAVSARKRAHKSLEKAERELSKLKSLPREIYQRDTTRDSIATCAKLTAFMLIEYALREYFGGLRIEARTFIERFVQIPVVIRSSKRRRLHQLQGNPRDPEATELLRVACAVVNARNIHDGEQLLRFEVVDQGPD